MAPLNPTPVTERPKPEAPARAGTAPGPLYVMRSAPYGARLSHHRADFSGFPRKPSRGPEKGRTA
jgi:hypothetical protein